MGVGSFKKSEENSGSVNAVRVDAKETATIVVDERSALQPAAPGKSTSNSGSPSKPAKSILRTPKYTKKDSSELTMTTSAGGTTALPQQSQGSKVSPELEETLPTVAAAEESSSGVICKNMVVERDPTKPMFKRKTKPRPTSAHSHSAVEGYVPLTASDSATSGSAAKKAKEDPNTSETPDSDQDFKDAPPLILNSLEDLFQAAGKPLPLQHDPNKITADTQLLEADIAFSVMTQDQYDGKLSELREQHEEERQAQLRIFMGKDDIFEGESDDDHSQNSDDDEDEDDLLEMLMGGDEEEENDEYFKEDAEDEETERQPRAFRLLWETLSEWITPEAAQYISHLAALAAAPDDAVSPSQWKPPVIERSDVEASRCAGLMAMVKLYLPKSLEELGYSSELRRTADQRLGELLRTFCYVQEAPKFPVKLWKAMTCILLEIVMFEQNGNGKTGGEKKALPLSVATVEMTTAEYHYMTRSAIQTFCFT